MLTAFTYFFISNCSEIFIRSSDNADEEEGSGDGSIQSPFNSLTEALVSATNDNFQASSIILLESGTHNLSTYATEADGEA